MEVTVRGNTVRVGTRLQDMDPRSVRYYAGTRTPRIITVTYVGETHVIGTSSTSGRRTRISIQRLRSNYGQSNGYQVAA